MKGAISSHENMREIVWLFCVVDPFCGRQQLGFARGSLGGQEKFPGSAVVDCGCGSDSRIHINITTNMLDNTL